MRRPPRPSVQSSTELILTERTEGSGALFPNSRRKNHVTAMALSDTIADPLNAVNLSTPARSRAMKGRADSAALQEFPGRADR